MANQLIPSGQQTRALVGDAAVSDELERAGMGLGELVKNVGLAVAETQSRLNETGANTATALAQTRVDVIAVEEKIYDNNGVLNKSESHTIDQKLPLITFIDPVFYQWTNVRLQGRFIAREFQSEAGSESDFSSSGSSRSQSGLFLLLGGGHNSRQYSNSRRQNESDYSSDFSYGQMRMNTLLEPRDDVGIPKPNQVIRGPRLSLIQGEIQDVIVDSRIAARTMAMIAQYNTLEGAPISGKKISIESDTVSWSYTGDKETDVSGQVEFLLRREFPAEEADTTPIDVVISARIGLVQNNITVVF